jgi:hypothetical protein
MIKEFPRNPVKVVEWSRGEKMVGNVVKEKKLGKMEP